MIFSTKYKKQNAFVKDYFLMQLIVVTRVGDGFVS